MAVVNDLFAEFNNGLSKDRPWNSIVDFVCHRSFLGYEPFPRQLTLLKLIFLETDNMTPYDLDVIEEWRNGFGGAESVGVQPDIWERVVYLKANGYRRFPHVQTVLGRRASKGWTGGIVGAEHFAYMISLDNWQKHYGIQPNKVGYLSSIATNLPQAIKFQFADIKQAIEDCKYLDPYKIKDGIKDHIIKLQTPSDKRYVQRMRAKRLPIDREVASLQGVAMTSTSSSGRGATGFANFYDEFAHMIVGTDGPRSSEQVYCLDPSTKILTADLNWIRIEDLNRGDELIGIEDDTVPGRRRRLQKSTVNHVWDTYGLAYKIIFEDGTSVICSKNHRWMAANKKSSSPNSSGNSFWRSINTGLRVGNTIRHIVEPWKTETSHAAGYIAGVYDGEGWVSSSMARKVGFIQNTGLVLEKTKQLLDSFDVRYAELKTKEKLVTLDIVGIPDTLSFLGRFRPERLLPKAESLWKDKTPRGGGFKTIISIEELPEQRLIDIETSTGTFIAEGFVSHNSAYQPSLRQFGKDGLTYIPSSPFSKIGKFFELYTTGSVMTREYQEKNGIWDYREIRAIDQDEDPEESFAKATADPTMLIIQLPSWGLYKDYDKCRQIGLSYTKTHPIIAYDDEMRILEATNKTSFKVEYRGQFAEVEDAYLDSEKIEDIFKPFWPSDDNNNQGRILGPVSHGQMAIAYHGHADPGLTGANFAVSISHLEDAPADKFGNVWPHAIVDFMKVWNPADFPDHRINYEDVLQELQLLLGKFPSMEVFSFDQWNSAGFISKLKQMYGKKMTIKEVNFTAKENFKRAEKFKSAVNLGWVHSYKDNFLSPSLGGGSLLEQELKFLTEHNGQIVKQDFGPVTTKDLADTVMESTTRLLERALDRWKSALMGETAPVFGEHGTTRTIDNASRARGLNGLRQGTDNSSMDNMHTISQGAKSNRFGRSQFSNKTTRWS